MIKKIFSTIFLILALPALIFAQDTWVDGGRVETFRRITVNSSLRGKGGLNIDPDQDGVIEMIVTSDGALQLGSSTVDGSSIVIIKGAQAGDPQVQFSLSADGVGGFTIATSGGTNGDITFTPSGGHVICSTDLSILGDDLLMTTNTLGALLVGDGTNFNPVVMSADASIAADGAVTVADDSHAHTGSTLSGIDISSDTNLVAGDALTLTDDDIDFDGGASPGGELGGTWASPTIDDSLAVTSWNLTTPTLTTSATVSDAFTLGLGAGKGLIQFDDETTDFVSFLNCNVGVGTATPGQKIVSIGAISFAGTDSITDFTVRNFRIGSLHYNLSEEPVGVVYAQSAETENMVSIGGGSSYLNAANTIKFFTATDTTTTTGTERMRITGTGNVGIGATVPDTRFHIKNNKATEFIAGEVTTAGIIEETISGVKSALLFTGVAENAGVGNRGAIMFDAGETGAVANNRLSLSAEVQTTLREDLVITGEGKIGIGTIVPDRTFHTERDSATTNALVPIARFTVTSSGTPLAGLGPSIEFESETSAGAPGNMEVLATIGAFPTDVSAGAEYGALAFGVMINGAAASEVFRIHNSNLLFGTTTAAGTSGQKVFVHGLGTAPTTSPADVFQWWIGDYNGAGSARLYGRTEEGNSQPIALLSESQIAYGVAWDESTDTYVRLGRTAGHKVGATLPAGMLPIQEKMRRCILSDAGSVVYYLSPTNSAFKIDGTTASNLTGTDGQVMVEVGQFWQDYQYIGTTHYWLVSPCGLTGFTKHQAFYKDGAWVENRYIGAYKGVLYDTSITAYVDGVYQTAWSCTFATVDDSITANSRTAPFKWLTVGQKITVSGTVSNNATVTVASLVSDTKITVSENLTDETAAATVVTTQKDFTATTGDKLSSVSGKTAINYLTRANARVIAANRGAGWRQLDYDLASAIQLLYLTEYASFYSQSMIGAGITGLSSGDWTTYNDLNPLARSGNSNTIGNATGNTAGSAVPATEVTAYLSYRGIENWFGHLWEWIDGININGNIPYITNNSTNWVDDTSTNYTNPTDVLGVAVTLINADGYQASLEKMSRGFLPASVGATSSTKITDYYYQGAGWCVFRFGGNAHDGVNAGAFCAALNGASSYLGRSIVGRLAY